MTRVLGASKQIVVVSERSIKSCYTHTSLAPRCSRIRTYSSTLEYCYEHIHRC